MKWFTANVADAQAFRHPKIGLAQFGASVERETTDPADAWAQAGLSFDDFEPARFPWPPAE